MARKSRYEIPQIEKEENLTYWKVGIYLRLSREDGDKLESESIISQRGMLTKFVQEHSDMSIYDTYVDDGYTGTNYDRPAFKRMLNDISEKRINCVVVKDLSRFGRNTSETSRYIQVVFPLLDIRFISLLDDVDSYERPESINNLVVPFKNIMNEEYARENSKKVKTACDSLRKKGSFLGGFACYGYIKDPNDHHKLLVDKEVADNVKMIFDLFINGMSTSHIARKLNDLGILSPSMYKKSKGSKYYNPSQKGNCLWAGPSIKTILSSEAYIGSVVQGIRQKVSYKSKQFINIPKENQIIVPNMHEAIISKEIFELAQQKLNERSKNRPNFDKNKNRAVRILGGLVCCGDCNHNMRVSIASSVNLKGYYYFYCPTYKQSSKVCSKHSTRNDILEGVVFEVLRKYVELAVDVDGVIKKLDKQKPETIKNTNQILKEKKIKERQSLNQALSMLYMQYKNEQIDHDKYINDKNDIENKISHLDSVILTLSQTINNNVVDTHNNFVSTFKKYKNFTSLTREMALELIKKIKIYDDKRIEVELNFQDEFEIAIKYLESELR